MTARRLWLLAAVIAAAMVSASAQEAGAHGVGNSFMLGVGSAHRADTYLTPLHYDGMAIGLGYQHSHLFDRDRTEAFWTLDAALQLDRTLNPVRNSSMLGAQVQLRWNALRRWRICDFLEAGVGGGTTLDAGALYLRRNGNNPVAANAAWTVDVAAYAAARFRVAGLPVRASYQASLPVIGAMFAPDYGQLYYEIYLGDTHGLASVACWGRYFRLDQLVAADIRLGGKYLRVGYGCDIVSTKVHGIVSRRIDHVFVVGITTDLLSFSR